MEEQGPDEWMKQKRRKRVDKSLIHCGSNNENKDDI